EPLYELTPVEEAAREELRRKVRQAVRPALATFKATLTPDELKLYEMRYVKRLTVRAISKRIGRSRTTTGKLLKALDDRRTDHLRQHLAHLRPDIDPGRAAAS